VFVRLRDGALECGDLRLVTLEYIFQRLNFERSERLLTLGIALREFGLDGRFTLGFRASPRRCLGCCLFDLLR